MITHNKSKDVYTITQSKPVQYRNNKVDDLFQGDLIFIFLRLALRIYGVVGM